MTLPSSRSLAGDLGLSRSTVVAVYEQLTAEGYLQSTHGSATRVARLRTPSRAESEVDLLGPTPLHDFRPGEPAGSSFPRRRWLRSVRNVMNDAPDSAFAYPDPRGAPKLRTTLAAFLGRTRTVEADRSAIRVVAGYSSALGFLADTLRSRRVERIAIEDPSFPVHTQVLRATGLRTVPIPVDDEGLDVERLGAADVGAVVVTPAHQYPTGVTMSAERRGELIDWARRTGGWIIEDDYDGEYRYDRRPIGALQGLAPDRVIYAGTASKSLAPALRIAWMVVPGELRHDLLRVCNMRAAISAIDQYALVDFIERGELDRHVRHMRATYRRRSEALRVMLGEAAPWLTVGGGQAGLHLMARLTSGRIDEPTVLAACAEASVGVLGLRTDHGSAAAGSGLSIGFSRPSDHHFPAALDRFGAVLADL